MKNTDMQNRPSAGAQFIENIPMRLSAVDGREQKITIKGTNINTKAHLIAIEFSTDGDGLLDKGQTLSIYGPLSAPPTKRSGVNFNGAGRPFMEVHIRCGSVNSLCDSIRNGTNEYSLTLNRGAVSIKNLAVIALHY